MYFPFPASVLFPGASVPSTPQKANPTTQGLTHLLVLPCRRVRDYAGGSKRTQLPTPPDATALTHSLLCDDEDLSMLEEEEEEVLGESSTPHQATPPSIAAAARDECAE